jgi:dolichyl-phosphate beta-glucosyltransferase
MMRSEESDAAAGGPGFPVSAPGFWVDGSDLRVDAPINTAPAFHAADHDLTLVVPCYNERTRLPRTLTALAAALDAWRIDYRVLVVDDGSTDGTPDLVAEYGPRFAALRQPANRGKGAAVRAGMLAAGGRITAFTDADLPYELDSLRAGYDRLLSTDADAAFGSRVLAQAGRKVPSPFLRRAAGGVFRLLVRRLVTAPVTDTQCGLKLFRREAARRLFSQATIDGFAFDVEVIYLANRLGLRWSEIPVVLINEGESTVSLRRHGPAMLRDLAHLAWRDWRGTAFSTDGAASRDPAAAAAIGPPAYGAAVPPAYGATTPPVHVATEHVG